MICSGDSFTVDPSGSDNPSPLRAKLQGVESRAPRLHWSRPRTRGYAPAAPRKGHSIALTGCGGQDLPKGPLAAPQPRSNAGVFSRRSVCMLNSFGGWNPLWPQAARGNAQLQRLDLDNGLWSNMPSGLAKVRLACYDTSCHQNACWHMWHRDVRALAVQRTFASMCI